jgi:hypothetical protein
VQARGLRPGPCLPALWTTQANQLAPAPTGTLAKAKPHPDSQAAQIRDERPQGGGKRTGGFRQAGTDEDVLEAAKKEEQRRVDVWKKEHPAEAQELWEEIMREATETGMDALGKRHLLNYGEMRMRRRVVDEILTPKLAAS